MLASLGKMPTTSARRLTSLLRRSSGGAVQLGSMLTGESHVGEHVMFAVIHQRGELGPSRAELIGDVSPGLVRRVGVGLQEGLADRRGDHGVLALLHMRQGVAHPMNPGAVEKPRSL